MSESNLESSFSKLNEKNPLEQRIIHPMKQLKRGQLMINKVEIESDKNDEIHETKDFCDEHKSSTIEGVKHILQNSFDGELENNEHDSSLPKLCNILGSNSQVNDTLFLEVQKNLFIKEAVQDVVSFEEMYEAITEFVNRLQVERIPSKKISLVEVAYKYYVLKGMTMNSIPQNLERFLNEALHMGLEWVPIDDNEIAFRVDFGQPWLVALIVIYEAQINVKIHNTIHMWLQLLVVCLCIYKYA